MSDTATPTPSASLTQQVDRITSGPILRTVVSLALPVVGGMFLEIALSVVNIFWVGKLGPAAQDAITSTMVILWTLFSFFSLTTVGVTAYVSRYIGAREPDQASRYARQGLLLSLGIGLFFAVFGWVLAPMLLRLMGTSEATWAYALPYARISFLAAIFFAVGEAAYAVFRSLGNTRTPLVVSSIAVLLNIVLDPLLIFGFGPFPRMEVAGAAVATLISVIVAAVVILWKLFNPSLGLSLRIWADWRPSMRSIGQIAKVGLPITTQGITFTAVYWFLIDIVHRYGSEAGAAMGIGNRMESISYLTCYGFSLAASTMVGQNLGAGNPERAGKCAWSAVGMAVAFTCVMSVVFLIAPRFVAGLFTNDPAVLAYAADYLIILGLSQFTMAIEIVLEGSFSGAGDTIPPVLVMLPGAIIRVPMAYYLCDTLGFGLNGVWWTMTITTTLKAAVLALLFRLGRWKRKAL